ncbi:MAG: restriction endonuclease subunit S [Desulfarculaceae bacterium]|nr:restriction endonuclease subunit S [Desulfarculaceae bacterium]
MNKHQTESNGLPNSWAWVELAQSGEWRGGGTPKKSNPDFWENGDILWISPKDVKTIFIADTQDKITLEAVENSAAKIVPNQSIVFVVRSGILRRFLPIALTTVDSTINQDLKALTPYNFINSKFALYACLAHQENIRKTCSKDGTTVESIEFNLLKKYKIPLAPVNEQPKIVSKIEELFSKLDAGVAALEKAQALLKRYRASVLKAACEGRLVPTEAELARKEKRAYESAEALLERILEERRAAWEGAELAKMVRAGKSPKNDKWMAKYKEPAAPDTSDLPKLPEGWVWATVEQLGAIGEQPVLTGPFGTNLGRDDFISKGIPVLTIGCLTEQGIDLEKAVYISSQKADELDNYKVNEGDLLFSRMATVGRVGYVTPEFEGSLINYHIMRLRLNQEALLPSYFLNYVRGSHQVIKYVRKVNHGATRDGINTKQLLSLPIPLPPLEEQCSIVADIDRRFSVTNQIYKSLAICLSQAKNTRQTVLRKAFQGKLVPQDPDDEPASLLLEQNKAGS